MKKKRGLLHQLIIAIFIPAFLALILAWVVYNQFESTMRAVSGNYVENLVDSVAARLDSQKWNIRAGGRGVAEGDAATMSQLLSEMDIPGLFAVFSKNGAVIYLKSSWALNMADPREAITTICGDKAGADMLDGLRINTIMAGKQVMITPDLSAGSVAFFDGAASGEPADLECATFTNAILGKGELYVTADQAAVVTHILEGIYKSEETGKPYYFD